MLIVMEKKQVEQEIGTESKRWRACCDLFGGTLICFRSATDLIQLVELASKALNSNSKLSGGPALLR
jgi:hypothetical protein